ncbi:MAG: hypothetical protein K8I27_02940 [Planctomycetes bacterium]|nr:hypothetical protein [Planctomycetota bacterium]
MKLDTLMKGVFALAALLAAGTYAYNSFIGAPEEVQASGAAGINGKDGFVVSTFGDNQQGGYVAVTKYAENPFEPGTFRHCITFYQIVKAGSNGNAELFLVGSRCLDYDAGPDMIKFEAEKGYAPAELKEAIEKASKKRR